MKSSEKIGANPSLQSSEVLTSELLEKEIFQKLLPRHQSRVQILRGGPTGKEFAFQLVLLKLGVLQS
jgi:hypothetical protein